MRTLVHLALTLSLVTAAAEAGAATGGARVEAWSIGGVAVEVAVESARFALQRGGAEPEAVVLKSQGGVEPVAGLQPAVPRLPASLLVAASRTLPVAPARWRWEQTSAVLSRRDAGGGVFRPG